MAVHRPRRLAEQHQGLLGRGWGGGQEIHIPLVQNLLRHPDLRSYYLDHVEHLLDTEFTPGALDARMRGDPQGSLWPRIAQAAFLEADTPWGAPFTGRQFTNDEVYRSAHEQYELRHGNSKVEGIVHYVRMRTTALEPSSSSSGPRSRPGRVGRRLLA